MRVEAQGVDHRDMGKAITRGLMCRCPHCGEGKMYRAYLKVVDHCEACGEQLNLHKADDFPPYVAIMIIGHLLVAVMLHMEMTWHINPMMYVYTMVPLAIILPLAILPSTKGAIIGYQWANRMHGFDPAHRQKA